MHPLAAWAEAEQGRFVLLLPIAMGSAILAYFTLKTEPPLWLGIAFTLISLTACAITWRWPPAGFFAARGLATLALAASLGFTRAELRTQAAPPLLAVPFGSVAITGTIAAIDDLPTGRRVTLTAATLNIGPPLARALRVKLSPRDQTAINPGDAISLRAILFKPERPAYPGGWDSTRDAFFEGLGASGFELGTLTITTPANGHNVAIKLRHLREAIAANINANLPPATASVAVTLLTGLQNQMAPAERQQFITAGLAHLLAVAGLHVGIVMGLFYGATRFLLTRREHAALHLPVKPIAAIAALAAGILYALLTGAHLPILRSLAMASFVTAGILAGRSTVSLRGLAYAAMAILLATPEAIIGVSFQMSFSAVLALISGYAAAKTWLATLREDSSHAARMLFHLASLFLTSLLAGGASMPFAAYQFAQIQPYWILANLIAVPLTALWIMPAGIAALALMPFHLETLALIPMGWGMTIILKLIAVIAAWPDAMLRVPPMPSSAILAYTAGLAWLCIWRTKLRFAGLAAIALALALYAAATPPAILISPDAKLIAIRTGPGSGPGTGPASGAGGWLLRAPKASAYTLAQWSDVWPRTNLTPIDPASCTGDICQIPPSTALMLSPDTACPPARIILSPLMLRGACAATGATVIDRLTTYREGAIAIWPNAKTPALLTDRDVQGSRPWVPPWPNP